MAAFATLEDRVNTSVLARLSNARISIDGDPEVDAIFDRAYVQAGEGALASASPQFTVAESALPTDPVGRHFTVTAGREYGKFYRIAALEPDGSGLVALVAESRERMQ